MGGEINKKIRTPILASIREEECIGCTKCIQACPVDAIIGSHKLMHTIITNECIGCGLCVAPCPVDCIEMVAIPAYYYDKTITRQRHRARQGRLLDEEQQKQEAYRAKRHLSTKTEDQIQDKSAKQTYILEALERSKQKRTS